MPAPFDKDTFSDNPDEPKSKTRLKQEMHALQDLGAAILELSPGQQAKIPMSDALKNAIVETAKVKGNSAKKRNMQFIGKLLRSEDVAAITQAYTALTEHSHRSSRQHVLVEKWRDQLIQGDQQTSESFIDSFPQVDRQQLRQLIRAAQKEVQDYKPDHEPRPVAQARKLFQFLRDTIAAHAR